MIVLIAVKFTEIRLSEYVDQLIPVINNIVVLIFVFYKYCIDNIKPTQYSVDDCP